MQLRTTMKSTPLYHVEQKVHRPEQDMCRRESNILCFRILSGFLLVRENRLFIETQICSVNWIPGCLLGNIVTIRVSFKENDKTKTSVQYSEFLTFCFNLTYTIINIFNLTYTIINTCALVHVSFHVWFTQRTVRIILFYNLF